MKKNYLGPLFDSLFSAVTTRENISTKFKVGQTVNGGFSGVTGKIIRRNVMTKKCTLINLFTNNTIMHTIP